MLLKRSLYLFKSLHNNAINQRIKTNLSKKAHYKLKK